MVLSISCTGAAVCQLFLFNKRILILVITFVHLASLFQFSYLARGKYNCSGSKKLSTHTHTCSIKIHTHPSTSQHTPHPPTHPHIHPHTPMPIRMRVRPTCTLT